LSWNANIVSSDLIFAENDIAVISTAPADAAVKLSCRLIARPKANTLIRAAKPGRDKLKLILIEEKLERGRHGNKPVIIVNRKGSQIFFHFYVPSPQYVSGLVWIFFLTHR
jgi:hypothetical protein